ncbi:hypothetical protein [Sulfuriroseicoccus oceanibius]|uniref:Lipoprotein n=1 Tax=Sulfuriroseicoccus oceanibius TaxID=2707525 RepID=A0A6B3LGV0_9BACT|nr:hypothetical protein [Sulfuriroseicoccus oceanibius]QQL44418.1 hypothetical protein G3M56_011050 [Sulfuriroseicoccus oceanibius]
MRIIAILAVIGLLSVSGCKNSSDEVNHPDEAWPLYEDRVFQQEGVFSESKINIALIEQLEPWNEELLLRLFEPVAGTKIVYTYKSTYRIPENIDGTEGVYDEYLIVETSLDGEIEEALLYQGGPKQGPVFHYLFRASEPNQGIKNLSNTSKLKFVCCPYDSFGFDYFVDARIVSVDGEAPKEEGEQAAASDPTPVPKSKVKK